MKMNVLFIGIILANVALSQNIKKKTFCLTDATVKVKSTVYTLSDYTESANSETLVRAIDTLPRQTAIGPKLFYVLFSDDSTKRALSVMETRGITRFVGRKFGVGEFYKNGNPKSGCGYDRKFRKSGFVKEFHENGMIALTGKCNKGKKIGEWIYFNEDGDIIKEEKYKNGMLVNTRTYDTPKKTIKTLFMVKRDGGLNYTLN